MTPMKPAERALPASKWLAIFAKAGVDLSPLGEAKNDRAKAIVVGRWLAARVGREVPVTRDGRSGKAVLRVIAARANEKKYFFEISLDAAEGPAAVPQQKVAAPAAEKVKGGNVKTAKKPSAKPQSGGNAEEW